MERTPENRKSIMEMARGAIMERVDYEMSRVIDNIMDFNTKAAAKRKITVTLEFTPDDNRNNITVSAVAKSTLAPTNPVKTSLYVAGQRSNGSMQVAEMVPNIPGQMDLDGEEQEAAPVLKLVKEA